MTELEKAAIRFSKPYSENDCVRQDVINAFESGAEWQAKQSPWIDINNRSVTMPNDKMCLLRLEDGTIVRDTEEWEDEHRLLVTHWMPIPE